MLTACVKQTAEECRGEEVLLLAVDALSQAAQSLDQVSLQLQLGLVKPLLLELCSRTSGKVLGTLRAQGCRNCKIFDAKSPSPGTALSMRQAKGWVEGTCSRVCYWQAIGNLTAAARQKETYLLHLNMKRCVDDEYSLTQAMPACSPLLQLSHAAAHQRQLKLQVRYKSVNMVGLAVHVLCQQSCLIASCPAVTSIQVTLRSCSD